LRFDHGRLFLAAPHRRIYFGSFVFDPPVSFFEIVRPSFSQGGR
jgi:hypothetical protein